MSCLRLALPRSRRPGYKAAPGQLIRGPVESVHIDQTYEASVARVHRHLGKDAERLLKGRVRIINVWRPINNPVAHYPLAVSDWRYLDTEHDLVSAKLIYPDRVGGALLLFGGTTMNGLLMHNLL